MSLLLKDRVWVMLSGVAKRGIFPLHASKMGVFRIPTEITERSDISSISNDLKNSGFKIDTYADRIYITYKWNESSIDPTTQKDLTAELHVTVEVVTGEVVDIIYQIKPLEFFGDPYWVRNYRQKANQNCKMIIDTVIRNTKIGDKLIAHYQKAEKLSFESAVEKLESLTPLAKNPKVRSVTTTPSSGLSVATESPAPPAPAAITSTVSAAAAPAAAAAGGGNTTIS
ncbi:MAG TPA: hypothetical protein VE223_04050, partial [Nitrososphaeraceae archaeon]|nr:hypothetical protein [Nitrososphaeraceae archaeon]